MDEISVDIPLEPLEDAQETPIADVFVPPSIHQDQVLRGNSYTHHSAIPASIKEDMTVECVLGIDEAGRGPVLGPMVYGLYYLPLSMHKSLLADTHSFDDSKALTPQVRSELMEKVCTQDTDLFRHCGWAIRSLSAKDISSAMLRPNAVYNLNAQAMDATIDLIKEVLNAGVNVRDVFIDTIGQPAAYQKKLEKIFPALHITVAKKADSLYPCVSAASVCAKVSRDASLEILYKSHVTPGDDPAMAWGSGYPSDPRCSNWLRTSMDPVFGWSSECRFSWSTAKEMLEVKGAPCRVDWPEGDNADDNMKLTDLLMGADDSNEDVLSAWFGRKIEE